MMKGLMGSCLNHEMALGRIRVKARLMEDELNELKAQKTVQGKKLALSEEAWGELEKQMELLRQVLVDNEKEISDAKDQLRQVKDETIREYRDSDAILAELGGSFAEGFNDCLRQVKASYSVLDLSHMTIDAQAQTTIQPIPLRARANYLLMMPSPTTLVVTERLPPLQTTPVIMTKYKQLKMKKLPSNNSLFVCFFIFYFTFFMAKM